MKNFSRNKGERRDGGGRREKPNMHAAVCFTCGKKCEVPFRPTGDKPIYCSSCFEQVESTRGGDYRKRDGGKKLNINTDISLLNDHLVNVNNKLEKIIEILSPVKKETTTTKKVVKSKKEK